MFIGIASLTPRVGKSTVAEYLKTKHNFLCAELNEPIIVLAEKFFGYNGDKSDPAQRSILQEIGLAGKKIDPTIWLYQTLNLLRRKMWGLQMGISPTFLFHYNLVSTRKEIQDEGIDKFFKGKNIVLSGIRSPLEAEEIKKLGGAVILISNNRIESQDKVHEVENQLTGYRFNGKIENNGSFDDLYANIDIIVNAMDGVGVY